MVRKYFGSCLDYGAKQKPLIAFSLMVMFFCVFDGIISYISPLIITEEGFTKMQMGLLIGSSSIFGAIFDFALCRLIAKPHFRRFIAIMFMICLVYPLILWQAKTFWLFLLAMAFWGLYYDLFNFANFDFVSRYRNEKHSTSFGIISVFKNLGYALAPLIAGLAIIEYVGWKPFMLAFIFAVIALILFFTLIFSIHNDELGRDKEKGCTKSNIFTELRYWKKIGIYIWPLLAMSALITMSEAFFWTIGPIFSESFLFDQFNGLFFAAYTIPPLITGWIVGNISERMGKKKTAYLSFMAGSILLAGLAFTRNPYILIIIIFIASIFLSISWPSINGAYADYVFESSGVEKEIEGIEGFFSNIGFIIGPPLAGFLADYIGNIEAFAVFGIIASLAAFILMTFTPRQINIKIMG